MANGEQPGGAGRPAAATRTIEAVVAALMLALGVVVIVESQRLGGARWTSDGPASGYFPFYIGLIIAISSAAILIQALFGKQRNGGTFVDTVQLRRVMSVLLPAIAYVIVIRFLGVYVASAIYIALFMVVLGKYGWVRGITLALAINALLFLMFEVWFKVPLYAGTLDPLRFLIQSH
ncbi:MAG TPA: tripartite tricarboxylate transporter TctB family protein [Albitalea sp.]|uniref:tripartite tricarboxylate transporter TctB family protein n=1 Tax=Piscinibacter sp. TaxID=1903157 RepID=UPI002ED0DBB7